MTTEDSANHVADTIDQPTTAPMRVTPDDIEAEIASAHYFTAAEGVDMADPEMTDAAMPAPLKLHTFCVLVLRNGHTVAGESCCIDPRIFNAEKGRELALADAKAKVWPLLGFRLRDKLAGGPVYVVDTSKLSRDGLADIAQSPPGQVFRSEALPVVQGMPPHQVRMRLERDELSARLYKLNVFIKSKAFEKVDEAEQEMLQDQRDAMQKYLELLQARIALFVEAQDNA